MSCNLTKAWQLVEYGGMRVGSLDRSVPRSADTEHVDRAPQNDGVGAAAQHGQSDRELALYE